MKTLRLLLALLVLQPATAFGWGRTGHRVVGEIAEQHLTKKARKHVQRILGTSSMALVATWMDDIKSDRSYDHMRDWHWVTIPDGSTYEQAEKNPNGDVVEAIGRMVAALKSDTLSHEQETFCLKVLIHLVGDLHQPLHVGKGDDRGGNSFQVQWFKKGTNLHHVWDESLVDGSLLSYTELARSLDHATKEQIAGWSRGNVAEWAQENVGIRPRIYPDKTGENLSYEYQYEHWPLVQEQLLKGGIRLAALLNNIFA